MADFTKSEPTGVNRRAYPRSPVVVREARCICGIVVFFGYAQNISRCGLFISTTKRREAGDTYEIQFSLPGDKSDRQFTCNSKVMWSRPYKHGSPYSSGFGVQFIDLSDEDSEYIDSWVASVCANNPKDD